MAVDHLWPLLEFPALEGDEDELIAAYKAAYICHYVKDEAGHRYVHRDWAGQAVLFSEHAFDHAFTSTAHFREGLAHDGFSLPRAKRMLWIREVLAASAGTISRYEQTRTDSRGRSTKRRSFVVAEERYVVVLDHPRKAGDPFRFVTAFNVEDEGYLRELKQKGFLAETRPRK